MELTTGISTTVTRDEGEVSEETARAVLFAAFPHMMGNPIMVEQVNGSDFLVTVPKAMPNAKCRGSDAPISVKRGWQCYVVIVTGRMGVRTGLPASQSVVCAPHSPGGRA
jgi:hypothetical protein